VNFKRIQSLWKTATPTSGITEDASEALFRKWVVAIAMLIVPPLLLFIYYKLMFRGLMNPDAMDFAQLGRNLSSGHGFSTLILRPLALPPGSHGLNALAQPDVTHGPLYPFLLALAFGMNSQHGANDATVAIVSGVFYLLTIPVMYILGVRVFSNAVGLLSVVILTFNTLFLEYAASGLPITLYIFLMTCLMLVVYNIAVRSRTAGGKLPVSQYVLAGVFTGLLYLTDPIFIWIVPFVIGTIYTLTPSRKPQAIAAILLPMCILMLPWMARNAMLTTNPVFGLKGMEIWMNTNGYYPDLTAYRQFPSEILPGVGVFTAIVKKMVLEIGQIILVFPQLSASWILAFLLPCLLFQFANTAANALRRLMMFCLLGLIFGSLFFHIEMPIFVSLVPVMLVYSVAYLLHLTQQAQLRPGAIRLIGALIAGMLIFPLLSSTVLADKPSELKEVDEARFMNTRMQPGDIAFSDQPWLVAWYAGRPAVWIPMNDAKIETIQSTLFANTKHWLFLTSKIQQPQLLFSRGWGAAYNLFYQADRQVNSPMPTAVYPAFSLRDRDAVLAALQNYKSVPSAKPSTSSVAIGEGPESGKTH